jgi:uncharacterized protein YjiS (DUF1127 family)
MAAIRFEDASRAHAELGRHYAGFLARRFAARLLGTIGEWRRRATGRAELAKLDDNVLADIGISRAEAQFLSSKPFWRE